MNKTVDVKMMMEIDNKAINEYKIPRIVLMEHAGLQVSNVAAKILGKNKKKVCLFCGAGYNGGDGLVAARHLNNRGYDTIIFLISDESKCKKETAQNLNILKKLGIKINYYNRKINNLLADSDLIIDAMLGIGIQGKVRKPVYSIIDILNNAKIPILSVDVPSGLDSDTGKIFGKCIKANQTVTFTLPKKGFFLNKGYEVTGKIIIKDIGIPSKIFLEIYNRK